MQVRSVLPLQYLFCSSASLVLLSLCSVFIHRSKSHPCAASAIRKGISVSQRTWLQTVLSVQQCLTITCQLCCCTRNSRESRGVQSPTVCIPLAALSLGDACLAAWAVSGLCPCVIFTAETNVSSSSAKMRFET